MKVALIESKPSRTDFVNRFDNSFEILVEHALEDYEEEFDQLSDRLYEEDPTNQMGIDDFIFLGNFEWLQQEIWMLNKLKY